MPNHITNVVTMVSSPADVDRFLATHIKPTTEPGARSDHWFDFDTIVPMPQSVKNTMRPVLPRQKEAAGPELPKDDCGDFEVELYAISCLKNSSEFHLEQSHWIPPHVRRWREIREWLEAKGDAPRFWGRRALLAAAETGYSGWYEWSCANWGTKWGAYAYKQRTRDGGMLVIQFETAWSSPEPIFEQLSTLYPEASFGIVAIDEGGPEYEGLFSPTDKRIQEVPKHAERYRFVYGRDPYSDDDDDDAEEAN